MALDDGVFAQHETTIRHFQAWLAFYQESQDDELVKQVCQHVFSIPGIDSLTAVTIVHIVTTGSGRHRVE